MTQAELESYLLALGDNLKDKDLADSLIGYRVKSLNDDTGKLFAVIQDGSNPLVVNLRCDPRLVKTLQEKYESVIPAQNLDKRKWVGVICSGQLGSDEVKDLARLAYDIVKAEISD